MSDNPNSVARNDQIERAINRDVAGALTIAPHGDRVFTIQPRSMSEVLEFAKLMAVSGICIRPMFRGNPGACLAVTIQAMKWGADPFAVANKAFVVNDQLSYESQLIHAIVNSSPALAQRLTATFKGSGPTRQCLVVGVIKGEAEAREYESPKVSEITPKNSPLWKSDPDQQLFYYSTRAWSRRWVPEVLLGIYTPEELSTRNTIDLVPTEPEPQRPIAANREQPGVTYVVTDADGEVHEYETPKAAAEAVTLIYTDAARRGHAALEAAEENNAAVIAQLRGATAKTLAEHARELATDLDPFGLSPPHPTEQSPAPATPEEHPGALPPAGNGTRQGESSPKPADTAAAAPSQPWPGPPEAEDNLFVPLERRPTVDQLEYYARQLLALIAEKPLAAQRAALIRAANEGGIGWLKLKAVERYDEVMRELTKTVA